MSFILPNATGATCLPRAKKGHKPIEFVNAFSISMAICKPKHPRPYRITIVSDALITLPKLNYHSPAAGAK